MRVERVGGGIANCDMAMGMRRAAASLMLGGVVLLGPGADAQTSLIPVPPGHVKVTVEFRQAGQRAQSGIAGGTVIQVDPKGVTGSARVQAQESQRTVRQHIESFLLVQDGGEARLTVVEQVPEIVWFQQYAHRHRYITEAVVFRQVGTFLAVRPTILPDKRIRVKITPQISYRSDQGDGTISLVEASTEVVVQRGQPITIGGTDGRGEVLREFLLGYERVHQANHVSIVLTAESP
ncbi:MAG: type II and III secretion system protein [candidate division NC10 bacterium]|nr:type II and III secretion system protein [candidate division NC10 bacterium]